MMLPAAANWVQPEKRERKQRVNYNQNQYFSNALHPSHAGRYRCFLTSLRDGTAELPCVNSLCLVAYQLRCYSFLQP